MIKGADGKWQEASWADALAAVAQGLSLIHIFLRHVHHGLNLQEAIDLPMSHTMHLSLIHI